MPRSAPPAQQQAPSQAPRPRVVGGDPAEDDVQELIDSRKSAQNAYDAINASNPLSEQFGKTPEGGAAPTGPLARAQAILSNPAVRGYLAVLSDPAVGSSARAVAAHPNRFWFLGAEVALLIATMILRAWRASKSIHWAARLWTSTWTWGIFWAGALWGLPTLLLGQPYADLARSFWRATSGFLGI
jgi:hypothetical protein